MLVEYGYPHPTHVNRIIAGVLCKEIKRKKSMEGLIELLKCDNGYVKLIKI